MKLRKLSFLLLILVFGVALAKDPAPLSMLKSASSQMMSALKSNKSRLNNRRVLHGIVSKIIVPKFDLRGVSRSVVGRRYWVAASSQTRNQFVKAFTIYVIDMYSTALSSFSDEKITFRPMRSFSAAQTRVKVHSIIRRPGGQPINLNYRLVRKGTSWKIYDFSVSGVSMVQSYRAQFAGVLNQGGLQKLTKQLQARGR